MREPKSDQKQIHKTLKQKYLPNKFNRNYIKRIALKLINYITHPKGILRVYCFLGLFFVQVKCMNDDRRQQNGCSNEEA